MVIKDNDYIIVKPHRAENTPTAVGIFTIGEKMETNNDVTIAPIAIAPIAPATIQLDYITFSVREVNITLTYESEKTPLAIAKAIAQAVKEVYYTKVDRAKKIGKPLQDFTLTVEEAIKLVVAKYDGTPVAAEGATKKAITSYMKADPITAQIDLKAVKCKLTKGLSLDRCIGLLEAVASKKTQKSEILMAEYVEAITEYLTAVEEEEEEAAAPKTPDNDVNAAIEAAAAAAATDTPDNE